MFQPPLLMLALIVLLLATWTREGTTWTSTWQELQSTWSGFLDNFEVRDGMTEVARREFRDQANQISRPRIEGAESSRPSRETTNLEQPGPRIFTAATPTGRLAATTMRMSPPTTAAQPHWTTPTRPTPKGKELENKPVQDQTDQGLPGEGQERIIGQATMMKMMTISSWVLRGLMKKVRTPTRRLDRMTCPTKSPG